MMADMTVLLISYLGIVLATAAYLVSNIGVEWRGHRSKPWLAVMGLFLGVTVAAVVYLVA